MSDLRKLPSREAMCEELLDAGIARIRSGVSDNFHVNDLVRVVKISASGRNLQIQKLVGSKYRMVINPGHLERF